jgi:hypothetical protein
VGEIVGRLTWEHHSLTALERMAGTTVTGDPLGPLTASDAQRR